MYNYASLNKTNNGVDTFSPIDNMSINGQPLDLLVEGYRHLTVTGRGLIGRDVKTTSVPGRRGVWVDDYSDKERVLEIKYKLETETSSDLRDRFAKLNRLLRKHATSGFLEITFADEPEYTYYGYLQDVDDIEETSLSLISKFTLLIPDGYKKKRPQSSTGVVSLVDAEEVLPDEIVVTVNHDGEVVEVVTETILETTVEEPIEEASETSQPKVEIISKARHRLIAKDNTTASQDQFKKFSKEITLKPNTTYTVSARGKSDYFEKNGHYGFLDFGNDIRENTIIFKNTNYEVKTLTFRTDDVVNFRVLARMSFGLGQEDWKGFALDWYVLVEGTETFTEYPEDVAPKTTDSKPKTRTVVKREVIKNVQRKLVNVIQIKNGEKVLSFNGDYSRGKDIVVRWNNDEVIATYDGRNILHELERFSPLEVFTLRNGDVITARNADVKKVTWRDERL